MNELNSKLEKLYLSKADNLSKMYDELQQLNQNDYSAPLLLHVWEKDYLDAPVKLMIIGQETNGWGDAGSDDVHSGMKRYEDFNMGRHYNSPFWLWARTINSMFGNPCSNNCFIWNNILKFGKESDKGYPDWHVTNLENKYFNVIADEISILKPDVCIFLTGPSYDSEIKSKFPDVEILNSGGYKDIKEVAQLKSRHLPQHSYRTYHPGYGGRYPDWYTEVFEIISNTVKKDLFRNINL